MTVAAAHLGLLSTLDAESPVTRQLAAFGRADEWLNSPRLTPSALAGKVLLIDFCTYTCINWLRTLPYVRAWAQKYRGDLMVIGVHTPEFSFEHNIENVRRALHAMRIDYPVAIDNDYSIWRAFDNQYWPALYFVDAHGRVRHQQFGEGDYGRSEKVIQQLLTDAGTMRGDGVADPIQASGLEAPADWQDLRSSENYVGYDRTVQFSSPGLLASDRRYAYAAPKHLSLNQWALTGEWTLGREAAVLNGSSGRILYRFHARDLHLVMAPPRQGASVRFRLVIDGQPPGSAHGLDVDTNGNGTVVEPRLYQLIRQPQPITDRLFEIEFLEPGVQAFSFTFG